jgi:hypothetical protein
VICTSSYLRRCCETLITRTNEPSTFTVHLQFTGSLCSDDVQSQLMSERDYVPAVSDYQVGLPDCCGAARKNRLVCNHEPLRHVYQYDLFAATTKRSCISHKYSMHSICLRIPNNYRLLRAGATNHPFNINIIVKIFNPFLIVGCLQIQKLIVGSEPSSP